MGPNSYATRLLQALQNRVIYQGTVPRDVIEKRRKKNKAARIARRNNR